MLMSSQPISKISAALPDYKRDSHTRVFFPFSVLIPFNPCSIKVFTQRILEGVKIVEQNEQIFTQNPLMLSLNRIRSGFS